MSVYRPPVDVTLTAKLGVEASGAKMVHVWTDGDKPLCGKDIDPPGPYSATQWVHLYNDHVCQSCAAQLVRMIIRCDVDLVKVER